MANTKKYVSLDKLGLYDEKIKKVITDGDAAALQSAKDYADGLASNYDAAGSAASAQAAAKTYTDTEIGKVNTELAGVKTTAEKGVTDAAAAQGTANQAVADAATAQAAADKAQGEVDALETYVGTFTASEDVDTVVKYIDAKTANIASDATVSALADRVTQAEKDIDAIEADYLKAADKTELSDAIAAEADRADKAEKANAEAIKAISDDYLKASDKEELQGNIDGVAEDVAEIAGDYLKASDKTELEGKINAKVAQTEYDAKVEEIKGTTDSLQTQINTIMNNPDAEDAINSINEFTAWVEEHGTIADGMRTDINANAKAIEDEAKAARAAEEALSGRLDALEDIDHEAYVAADTALKNELNGEIAKKADSTALASAVEALEGADTGLGNRITALENKFTGEGSVEDMIADAKQEAIDAAASAADTKDEAILAAAKKYADDEDAKIESRVDALETASATHALASDLTTLAGRVTTVEGKVSTLETEMDAVEAAVATKAESSDLTALAGRVATAEGEIDTLQSEMDAVEALAAANKTATETNATNIAKKADITALTAATDRITTLETWHENFIECSQEDINNLFKA